MNNWKIFTLAGLFYVIMRQLLQVCDNTCTISESTRVICFYFYFAYNCWNYLLLLFILLIYRFYSRDYIHLSTACTIMLWVHCSNVVVLSTAYDV